MNIEKINKKSIEVAIKILRAGGTIVYPTETAYALGCDATNKKAMAKIFKIKNRSKDKKLPVICATKRMAADLFKFGKMERKLAKKYWPGPLTIVLPAAAVRVSLNKIARAISRGLRRPIISTSANLSGQKTLYDIKEIIREFKNKKYQPDLVLDGGKLPHRLPSTIIKIENEKIITLRQGEVKI